jgi:glycosyltransferase involved in cell wall biosynthesis
MYNFADCTLNIADAEGFGLSSMESLSCETPVINTMTGGLQEQVTDGEKWFGVGIEPASKAVIGSLDVPYIYEDRVSGDDVIAAMKKMFKATPKQRAAMGKAGRRHLLKNYSHENYIKRWDGIFTDAVAKYGSWGGRQNHAFWRLEEIA